MYPVNPYIYKSGLAAKLLDGNTFAWYSFQDSVITKDGSNRISSVSDLSGSGNNILQSVDSKKPTKTATGILFDGIDDFLMCTFSSKSQPISIYILYTAKRTPSTGDSEGVFDGAQGGEALMWFRGGPYGQSIYAGQYYTASGVQPTANSTYCWFIKTNGTNSRHREILYIKTGTGDMGSNAITGITLGMQGGGTVKPSNIEIKEFVVRNYNDSDEYSDYVLRQICAKYGITPPAQ